MRIPLIVYLALSISLTHGAALPLLREAQVTLWQFLAFLAHTQLPMNFLVFFGAVSLWRGAWGLMDNHLFPENSSLSYLISLIIGCLILLSSYDIASQII